METRKSFDKIQTDYEFFEAHVTEIAGNTAALAPLLQDAAADLARIRLLDFGCGEGHFLEPMLRASGLDSSALEIGLVEPLDAWRDRAVEVATRCASRVVGAWSSLPAGERFDIIVSHHVLYYVADLDQTVHSLLAALEPHGTLIVVMGAADHPLILMWHEALGYYPYYVSPDLARVLGAEPSFQVANRLSFVDSEDNRMRIIRFMFADRLADIDGQKALRYFDRFSHGGRIDMPEPDDVYVVSRNERNTPAAVS